jgi:hypothetical protein
VNALLQKTLADAVAFLQLEHIEHALIGGLAASLRGEPRVTADVDLVIGADVHRALELLDHLEGSSFRPLFDDPADVVQRSFILPLRHHSTNIKVDMTLGLSGFEQQAMTRATAMDVAGTTISVATAEDLLIMKVLAGRPRDNADALGIIAAHGDRLDWDYCLRVASELGEALGQDLAGPILAMRQQLEC